MDGGIVMKKIVVAGGCFWGVQEYYRRLKGIIESKVGYAQGSVDNPTYEQVKSQSTNHREVVELIYDEQIISLEKIVEVLFRFIDPTIENQQGEDVGTQYQCGIYYETDEEMQIINTKVMDLGKGYSVPLKIEIEKLKCFYDAEEYHQMYLVKNPTGYCHVNFSSIKPEELKDECK